MNTVTRIVLHNPHAGLTWRTGRTQRALDALRAMPGTLLVPTQRGEVTAQVRALLTPHVESVFAAGGDGTVSDVAAALANTDVSLGIIPAGSTNTLAYEFGVPQDPMRAVEVLTSSAVRTRTLRTWNVGAHQHLVLGVGVGWDARLMHRTPDALKRSLGYLAFTSIGVWLAVTYDFPRLTVEGEDTEGRGVRVTGSNVLVANVRRWAGSRAVFPAADPAAPSLDVIVLQNDSRPELIAFWLSMMLPGGRPLRARGVRVLKLQRLSIAAEGPADVHVNGDRGGSLPMSITPGGVVQVLVPRSSS